VQLFVEPDVTPPRLNGAEALSPVQLWVVFSEPVDPFSASSPGNYEVLGPMGRVPVMNAQPQPAPGNNSVLLNLGLPLTPGALHTLVVMGVSDLAGNLIQPPDNSIQFVAP
jgi:hypothetical protein